GDAEPERGPAVDGRPQADLIAQVVVLLGSRQARPVPTCPGEVSSGDPTARDDVRLVRGQARAPAGPPRLRDLPEARALGRDALARALDPSAGREALGEVGLERREAPAPARVTARPAGGLRLAETRRGALAERVRKQRGAGASRGRGRSRGGDRL